MSVCLCGQLAEMNGLLAANFLALVVAAVATPTVIVDTYGGGGKDCYKANTFTTHHL